MMVRKLLQRLIAISNKVKLLIFISFCLAAMGLAVYMENYGQQEQLKITQKVLAEKLGKRRISAKEASEPLKLPLSAEDSVNIQLTIDSDLQEHMEKLFLRYKPDYAAFVAIDASTGKVLALTDFSKTGHEENLALRSTFPAASIFKVVTSAAAIEEGGLDPHSRIPFNGSTTSLYKKNINFKVNRWTRFVSLENALARSINSVFGKIAAHGLGHQVMQRFANAFYFNSDINFDFDLDESHAEVPEDMFGLAESGSGYTRQQTISPIHGAMIAASVINKGWMPKPYIVESVANAEGKILYQHVNKPSRPTMLASTAERLAEMMEKTILIGTARKHYRDYRRHPVLSNLFIGGKTGSLTGYKPRGKYDWFVGFAQDEANPERKIAFASMIINGKFWRVKSSFLARQAVLQYFRDTKRVSIAKRKNARTKASL